MTSRSSSLVRRWVVAAVCALALALAGCADDASPPTPQESAVDESEPTNPTSAAVPGADSPVVTGAIADLAATLGIDPSEVQVAAVEEVTWSDGSRGCAQKGMLYTQSLIDGSRITLRVGETTYEYHSGGSGKAFLCETPTQ